MPQMIWLNGNCGLSWPMFAIQLNGDNNKNVYRTLHVFNSFLINICMYKMYTEQNEITFNTVYREIIHINVQLNFF